MDLIEIGVWMWAGHNRHKFLWTG